MSPTAESAPGYNERLFSRPGLRSYYHFARFQWVQKKVSDHLQSGQKMVELGCFDGKLLDYIDRFVNEYVGLDANWEKGLDQARVKFRGRPGVRFLETTDPAAFDEFPDNHFTAAAALETLEHVPPELMPRFLDQLARVTRGHLFVSVPNELGPVFLVKHVAKALVYGGGQHYSPREFFAALVRNSSAIERDDHKGFDYRDVIHHVGERFDILSIEGLPAVGFPPALSPTVAIFAKSKATE